MHIDAIMFGFAIGYSSGDIKNLISDIQYLRPTVFGSFPAFYNKIYSKIREKIDSQPGFVQTIIDSAIQTKIHNYLKYGSLTHSIYDALIFRAMKKVMGGRVRFMVSGGAPLAIEIKNLLTAIFGAPIFEAYGMTEAAGCLTCTAYWDRQGGHVGGVLPCCRM
jgi:long-chain acyl-CoA synthetase